MYTYTIGQTWSGPVKVGSRLFYFKSYLYSAKLYFCYVIISLKLISSNWISDYITTDKKKKLSIGHFTCGWYASDNMCLSVSLSTNCRSAIGPCVWAVSAHAWSSKGVHKGSPCWPMPERRMSGPCVRVVLIPRSELSSPRADPFCSVLSAVSVLN